MARSDDDEERTMLHGPILPVSPGEGEKQSPSFLVVSGQSSAGKMFKLKGEMVIGRTAAAEIYLDDDGVSRRHARVVVRDDGAVEVSDLGSTNGTYYNGARIDTHVLSDGDTIQIGSTTILKFSYRDALKLINDTYGHPAGDYVLARLSQKMLECIRTEDTLARYGGEEFALVLREASEKQGFVCAERIRRTIEATEFVVGQTTVAVTMSFGVATYTGTEFEKPDDLIASSDMYLYRAKRGGRNRVEARMLSGP